jgi:hypothetical protein
MKEKTICIITIIPATIFVISLAGMVFLVKQRMYNNIAMCMEIAFISVIATVVIPILLTMNETRKRKVIE